MLMRRNIGGPMTEEEIDFFAGYDIVDVRNNIKALGRMEENVDIVESRADGFTRYQMREA
jgi:hypothetical protein